MTQELATYLSYPISQDLLGLVSRPQRRRERTRVVAGYRHNFFGFPSRSSGSHVLSYCTVHQCCLRRAGGTMEVSTRIRFPGDSVQSDPHFREPPVSG